MAPHRFGVVLSALVVALPLLAHAAPAGTVVVAQGVDPTTLDRRTTRRPRPRTWPRTSSTVSSSAITI